MADIKEVVADIIQGKFSLQEVRVIQMAITERKKQDAFLNQATLRIGDEVTLFGLSPKHWNGMTAEITSFSKQRARVDLKITNNNGAWKVSNGSLHRGFPISCVAPVGQTALEAEVDEDLTNALHAFLS